MRPKVIFVSIRLKLLIGFTLVFTLVFAVVFYWFYQFATELAMNRITQDLVDTLVGAVQLIDGDKLQELYLNVQSDPSGYPADSRYWEQVQILWAIKTVEPRASLYTYIQGEKPGELIFITSVGALNDPPYGAQYLEHWITENVGPNLSGLREITLQDTPPGKITNGCAFGSSGCKIIPYKDDFGSWVSAFAPIKNSKSEVVAAVGIDFRADYVDQVQREILRGVYTAFVITYASLFILVYFISRIFTQPILTLTKTAQKIDEGDF